MRHQQMFFIPTMIIEGRQVAHRPSPLLSQAPETCPCRAEVVPHAPKYKKKRTKPKREGPTFASHPNRTFVQEHPSHENIPTDRGNQCKIKSTHSQPMYSIIHVKYAPGASPGSQDAIRYEGCDEDER